VHALGLEPGHELLEEREVARERGGLVVPRREAEEAEGGADVLRAPREGRGRVRVWGEGWELDFRK
jgi:hypothetical protein